MVLDFLFGKKERKPEFGLLKATDKDYIGGEWERIQGLLAAGRPSAYKEAVIAADKMLDFSLKAVIEGESMGERLKNAREGFYPEVYQGLWDAHKMRNSLVHEASFDLTVSMAKDVLAKYQKGFQALGVRI
ncbi:MAG: hypothetical protein WEC39_00320 [Patescibacteria group bacterium]